MEFIRSPLASSTARFPCALALALALGLSTSLVACQDDPQALHTALLEFVEAEDSDTSRFADVTEEGLASAINLYLDRYSGLEPIDIPDSDALIDIVTGSLSTAALGPAPVAPAGRYVPIFIEGSMVRFYLDEVVAIDSLTLRAGWFWMVDADREEILCGYLPGRCGTCTSNLGPTWTFCP